MSERSGVITFQGNPLTLLGPELKVGDPVPDFEVVDGEFSPVNKSDLAGKILLVSTVPSLDTPVCQLQTKRFNEEAAKLPENVEVLTVSMDLPFAQARFCSSEKIGKLRTLSDHVSRSLGQNWGLLIKELGLLARSVTVVDASSRVAYVQLVPEITDQPDYAAALQAVNKLVNT